MLKNIQYLLILLIFVNLNTGFAQKSDESSIENTVNLVFNAYKSQNFNKLLPFTAKDFKDGIMNITQYQGKYGKLPIETSEIIQYLSSMKIVAQVHQKDMAIVSTEWYLAHPASKLKPNTYTKVIKKEFHLIKENGVWKISDAKNNGEEYLISR